MNFLEQFSEALTQKAEAARAFTAEIRAGGEDFGSGLLWRPDLVITSEQSLPEADAYEVRIAASGAVRATLQGRDPGANVAVLKLETALSATVLEAAVPVAGSLALAFGANGHGGISAYAGIVSAVAPEWRSRAGGRIDHRIMLDIGLGEDQDGGPVLDASGKLIGMSTLGHRGGVLAIPSSTVARSVEQLLQHGRVERGWLGVALQPVAVPEEMRAAAAQDSALMVMNADKNGPAAAAGVTMGDVMLQADGVPLDCMHALSDRLGPDSIGKQIQIKLIRAGAILSVAATIAARPVASEESPRMGENWREMAARWRHHHHHRGAHRHGC